MSLGPEAAVKLFSSLSSAVPDPKEWTFRTDGPKIPTERRLHEAMAYMVGNWLPDVADVLQCGCVRFPHTSQRMMATDPARKVMNVQANG